MNLQNLLLQLLLLPLRKTNPLLRRNIEEHFIDVEWMGACNFNAILEQFLKDFTCFLLIDRFDDLIVRGIWLKSLL